MSRPVPSSCRECREAGGAGWQQQQSSLRLAVPASCAWHDLLGGACSWAAVHHGLCADLPLPQAPPQLDFGGHIGDCSGPQALAGEGVPAVACFAASAPMGMPVALLPSLHGCHVWVPDQLRRRAAAPAPAAQVAGIGDALATCFEVRQFMLALQYGLGC